ncbi:efflux RND transporter periplasmic adaptor subunit [Marinobacter sp. CA1]|uniref:efflux RND transporter periplasmic adaptor subunit n=1 Tax=Marinobacter sp. CA1 TaxID=2817656 RepID=UPI001D08FA1A|nr:efflux RND transporter periplasmic adaptor subunit [Marinobacter sp. CA1]UDL06987.1 efflux RND transporter periplasmic adaptor subunit [Marinobacter sp. CA1]
MPTLTPSILFNLAGRRLGFTLAAAGGLLLMACSPPPEPKMPVARTVMVSPADVAADRLMTFSGTVQARRRSVLAFETGGMIRSLDVDLGDTVERHQPLATLDDEALRLDLRARRANLANAEADRREAELDYRRRLALADTGATSRSAIDQTRARFERAQAQVDALKAEVAQAQDRLEDATLLAPFRGEVTERLAEPAEFVAAGQPILHLIGERDGLEATIHVPGPVREALDTGQTLAVSVLNHGRSTTGVVARIGSQANRAGLFPITLTLATDDISLRPGETIEATWDQHPDATPLLIPVTAYIPAGQRIGRVFVVEQVNGQSQLAAREVVLGELGGQHIEVLSGLEPGELVVQKGVNLLQTGQTVLTAGVGIARYNQ